MSIDSLCIFVSLCMYGIDYCARGGFRSPLVFFLNDGSVSDGDPDALLVGCSESRKLLLCICILIFYTPVEAALEYIGFIISRYVVRDMITVVYVIYVIWWQSSQCRLLFDVFLFLGLHVAPSPWECKLSTRKHYIWRTKVRRYSNNSFTCLPFRCKRIW